MGRPPARLLAALAVGGATAAGCDATGSVKGLRGGQVDDQNDNRRWIGLAGLGVNFAGAVGGFCLLGYWIDRHWQIERHWGLLICALLGLVGGMYNMIRQALQVSNAASRREDRSKSQSDDDG